MMWFANLRTPTKLSVGFGFAVIGMVVTGYVGGSSMARLNTEVRNLATDALPGTAGAGNMSGAMRDARIRLMRVAIDDRKALTKNLESYRTDAKAVDDLVADYAKTLSTDEERKIFQSVQKAWQDQSAMGEQIIQFTQAGNSQKARDILDGESRQQFRDALAASIEKLQEHNVKQGADVAAQAGRAFKSGLTTIVVVTGLAALLSLFLAYYIGRLVSTMLGALSDRFTSLTTKCAADLKNAIEALERYDLTATLTPVTKPIEVKAKDDLSQMAETFNTLLTMFVSAMDSFRVAQSSLTGIVGKLQDNASSVANTSRQLADAANNTNSAATAIAETMEQVGRSVGESANSSAEIAKGTEQLATTATQAATAMEHLSRAIEAVQSGGEQQQTAVAEALENVTAGIDAVEQTVSSMKRIEQQVAVSSQAVHELGEKGRQIGDIVQTIEDIAQQTNLLALNAAIEAARAGEQGKGFAVVADEVRKLAEHSAAATQEIAGLITSVREVVDDAVKAMEASATEVAAGAERSGEAGEALSKINQSASAVGDVAKENLRAVVDMTDAAKQVEMSIQTAASVSEESAASAEELSATAEEVAASTEEVSASIEEQAAGIQEVSAAAQQLSAMSTELDEVVRRFKVDNAKVIDIGTTLRAA